MSDGLVSSLAKTSRLENVLLLRLLGVWLVVAFDERVSGDGAQKKNKKRSARDHKQKKSKSENFRKKKRPFERQKSGRGEKDQKSTL